MSNTYNADAIEVLTGLDPVRKRPGMYTDTSRPNHLIQEVIDNSVDEALAGFARNLTLTLNKDGTVEVADDGRGMPVDTHKGEKVSGVELILTRLHAGGKFSDKNYQYSGGLHGVGVSVVNALSKFLEVEVKRNSNVYSMKFKNGDKASELKVIKKVGKRNTGTTVRFLPDGQYFDSVKISVSKLKHLLRAKAVLCPGLTVTFVDNSVTKAKSQSEEWFYEDGLVDYLIQGNHGYETLPITPFTGSIQGNDEAVDWAIQWLPEGGEAITESYVNLIPTPMGGTHISGLRTGLLESIREFCEFRNLLPRGIKISPDDVLTITVTIFTVNSGSA